MVQVIEVNWDAKEAHRCELNTFILNKDKPHVL